MSTESTAFVDGLRDLGGPMTAAELDVVGRIHELFDEVLESGHGFDVAAQVILAALRRAVDAPHDPHGLSRFFDGGFSIDRMVELTTVGSVPIGDHPLTTKEESFCRDALGAIRFAQENGLSILPLAAALCHDLREICDAGGLDKAVFVPKVSGWATYSPDMFGSSESD